MLGSLPYAVSVDKTSETVGTTFLVIRYSFRDNKVNNDWHRGAANTTDNTSATRWNVTRCVPALQAEFNDHKHLLEMVAVSTALGVDHFVFYVESIGPDVSKALHVNKHHLTDLRFRLNSRHCSFEMMVKRTVLIPCHYHLCTYINGCNDVLTDRVSCGRSLKG